MGRATLVDKNGLKKGSWSKEEDNKLSAYVQRHGHWNWRQLPKFAGLSRCGKSCRLRWMNYLRPDVKLGNFSQEEDGLIIQLHKKLGNKWSKIAENLPGRTDNMIKNQWNTRLKKIAEQNQSELKQHYSNGTSKCTSTKDFEAETIVADAPPYPVIFESFPLSHLETSSSELSSSSSDFPSSSRTNTVAEVGLPTREKFKEPSGDFWTQPFLSDSCTNNHGTSPYFLGEGEFNSSYFSYYDDNMDYIYYQVMQELPKKLY